jgi:hypothetical protein
MNSTLKTRRGVWEQSQAILGSFALTLSLCSNSRLAAFTGGSCASDHQGFGIVQRRVSDLDAVQWTVVVLSAVVVMDFFRDVSNTVESQMTEVRKGVVQHDEAICCLSFAAREH